MSKGSSRRQMLIYVSAGIVAIAVVMTGEVLYALKAPRLPESAPYDLRRVADGPNAVRVAWLGDSTAAGVGASGPERAVPVEVASQATQPVDLTVLAVSGAKVADVRAQQVAKIPAGTQRIYISVGANDTTGLTSLDEFEREYIAMLDALPANVEITVLGVPDMGSPPRFLQPLRAVAGFRGRQVDECVRRAAAMHNARYVDIAGETGPKFRRDPARYFADDKFHPSDAGYQLWANAVLAR